MRNKIIQGDCLTVLKTLPNESVDCCITSPPYWGLRDYGTAIWEGGNPECKHSARIVPGANKGNVREITSEGTSNCYYCGAKRIDQQLGLEATPEQYVARMVEIFREVRRVLKKEGTCWLNLGDCYSGVGTGHKDCGKAVYDGEIYDNGAKVRTKIKGLKPKDLVGIPWHVAFALQADGWYLRQDIIWHKPNVMPESITDRCTKSHEYVFLLSKSQKYYFNHGVIKEPSVDKESYGGRRERKAGAMSKIDLKHYKMAGPINCDGVIEGGKKYPMRNRRSVWTINTKPFSEAHFATFPEDLIEPMVLAGCLKGGLVLDPFMGSGTTAMVAKKLSRDYLGIELNPEYIKIAERSILSEREPVLMKTLKDVQDGKQAVLNAI